MSRLRHKASGGAMKKGIETKDPTPQVVAGNKNVVAGAKSSEDLGKVPGIWAGKRLDRGSRKK